MSEQAKTQPRNKGRFAERPSTQAAAASIHDVDLSAPASEPPALKSTAALAVGDRIMVRDGQWETITWIGEMNGGARTAVLSSESTMHLSAADGEEWQVDERMPPSPLVRGQKLPGGAVDREVLSALSDWRHDGPSRSIAKRLVSRTEEDLSDRLSKLDGFHWIHGVDEADRQAGIVYWDVAGQIEYDPLEVGVDFVEYSQSEQEWRSLEMTAVIADGQWHWKW